MTPGRLDRQVTLQARNLSAEANGEAVESWTDLTTVWACVQPMRGRMLLAAQQTQAQADFTVTIRWLAGVVPGEVRILYGDVVHEILSAAEVGRRVWLEMTTKVRGAG